jgi:hypothetical protein
LNSVTPLQVTELSVKFTGVEEVRPPSICSAIHQTSSIPRRTALTLPQISFLNAGSGWQDSEKVTCHECIVPVMRGGALSCGLHKLSFDMMLPVNLPPTIKCITNQSAAKVTCDV